MPVVITVFRARIRRNDLRRRNTQPAGLLVHHFQQRQIVWLSRIEAPVAFFRRAAPPT